MYGPVQFVIFDLGLFPKYFMWFMAVMMYMCTQ